MSSLVDTDDSAEALHCMYFIPAGRCLAPLLLAAMSKSLSAIHILPPKMLVQAVTDMGEDRKCSFRRRVKCPEGSVVSDEVPPVQNLPSDGGHDGRSVIHATSLIVVFILLIASSPPQRRSLCIKVLLVGSWNHSCSDLTASIDGDPPELGNDP